MILRIEMQVTVHEDKLEQLNKLAQPEDRIPDPMEWNDWHLVSALAEEVAEADSFLVRNVTP